MKVVDVFAGPGGLNEGFSRYTDGSGRNVFEISGSFEVDRTAVETLKLRAAARAVGLMEHPEYRAFMNGHFGYQDLLERPSFRSAFEGAGEHVYQLRLGPDTRAHSDALIKERLSGDEEWVLIGGPPCQAYSLAGRSRMGRMEGFLEDERHFLFKEYLHIIKTHRPTVFVMENVKGLLSATHRGTRMFELILQDLSCSGDYDIRSLVVPSGGEPRPEDFVIRAEAYGIPQRRHRVILLGTRKDACLGDHIPLKPAPQVSLWSVISDLPVLRSRVSPLRDDSPGAWLAARQQGIALASVGGSLISSIPSSWDADLPPVYSGHAEYRKPPSTGMLTAWLRSPQLEVVSQHQPRAHMVSDLTRYSYLACMAEDGRHPTLKDLPKQLWPNHKNVGSSNTPFVDRFKAQSWDAPSSTIVSHISKDGHYFIHPDPRQARSLTVREAARLQTFPDDYFFVGNRTQQYHQVGNAVPPYLARQIAHTVAGLLGRSGQ